MVFTGYFEHGLDEKNRLAVPAKVRSRWDRERDGDGFFLVPGRRAGTLWLYTEKYFDALSAFADSSLIPDDEQHDFEEIYFTLAEHVDLDSQGRIMIPERMRRRAGLGRDLVICGVRDHLEIRNREDFERDIDANWQRYPEIQEKARAAFKKARRQPGREAGDS